MNQQLLKNRRLPSERPDTVTFYDYCSKGELRFQACADCGEFRHPPRPMCPHCNSMNIEWKAVKGTGTLYTWTIVVQALDKILVDDVPIIVGIVELDEGPRQAAWILGVAEEDLRVGMKLKVSFEAVTDKVALPQFSPA